VRIYDANTLQCKWAISGHTARVGALAVFENLVASGSRDRTIRLRDLRDSDDRIVLSGHKQEACGLKWNSDGGKGVLASGGNDNQLLVWDARTAENKCIRHRFTEHTAAVKALAWRQSDWNVLTSGEGTARSSHTILQYEYWSINEIDGYW